MRRRPARRRGGALVLLLQGPHLPPGRLCPGGASSVNTEPGDPVGGGEGPKQESHCKGCWLRTRVARPSPKPSELPCLGPSLQAMCACEGPALPRWTSTPSSSRGPAPLPPAAHRDQRPRPRRLTGPPQVCGPEAVNCGAAASVLGEVLLSLVTSSPRRVGPERLTCFCR